MRLHLAFPSTDVDDGREMSFKKNVKRTKKKVVVDNE